MLGIILILAGTLLSEASTSIGKKEAERGHEGIFTFAFLNLFFVFIFFLLWALIWPQSFVFSYASLPTFIARIVLEFGQIYLAILAITKTDRTTFSFFRSITIPMLLFADVALGYALNYQQISGILLLFVGVVIALFDKSISKKYVGVVVLTGINSAITISLYKYNITHFNSFVGEQLLSIGILLGLVWLAVWLKEHRSPFKLLGEKKMFVQSFFVGAAGLIESFAYSLMPASILVAASRSGSIIWSTFFGGAYFKEKHILHKIAVGVIIAVGFILLI